LGSQPIGVAFAPDGKALYVTCAGTNSIAIVRTGTWAVAGAIPTAWFPSVMAINAEGGVRLSTSRAWAARRITRARSIRPYEATLEKIPAPNPAQVAGGTREVKAANSQRFEPAGAVSNLPSLGIQQVFFIVKEKSTYDQVFGDIAKGNRDPKLVFYAVTSRPNHQALAENYVLLLEHGRCAHGGPGPTASATGECRALLRLELQWPNKIIRLPGNGDSTRSYQS
jgi:hypothetical protein